jgi:putative transposase
MKTKHGKAIEITDQLSSCAAQTLAQWVGSYTVIRNQKVIHGANMGQIRQFTACKLKDRGKLMIKVSARNTSLECSSCGNVDKENRKSQAMFLCTKCGHTANADDNAALNIKRQGITLIRSDAFSKEKTVRAVSIRKEKKAQELASSGDGDNVRLAHSSP